MRKLVAMISSIVVATILATLITTPALAVTVSKKQTVYLTSNNGTAYTTIGVSDVTAKSRVVKNSIKVSNPSVLTVTGLHYGDSKGVTLGKQSHTEKIYSDTLTLLLKKPGTCKVSFKVGSKTYSSTVVVKRYENPVKKFTITGVKGGKNLAAAFKSSSSVSGAKASGKKGSISVSAAKGWKIKTIRYSNYSTLNEWSRSMYSEGLSSVVFSIPTAMQYGTVFVSFENTTTGGTLYINYELS